MRFKNIVVNFVCIVISKLRADIGIIIGNCKFLISIGRYGIDVIIRCGFCSAVICLTYGFVYNLLLGVNEYQDAEIKNIAKDNPNVSDEEYSAARKCTGG